jgi:hypothetical protein
LAPLLFTAQAAAAATTARERDIGDSLLLLANIVLLAGTVVLMTCALLHGSSWSGRPAAACVARVMERYSHANNTNYDAYDR